MTTSAPGLRGYAPRRGAHSERRTRLRRLLFWAVTLAAAAVLPACDQSPPRRSNEPPATRQDREEVARLREFVDLLHREIEQLQKDKERLTEEVERLRLDNAALRAGKAMPAPATREATTLPTPVNGRKRP